MSLSELPRQTLLNSREVHCAVPLSGLVGCAVLLAGLAYHVVCKRVLYSS